MIKLKIEKIFFISFIGSIIVFSALTGGNFVLKASQPVNISNDSFYIEKRLKLLDDQLSSGMITKYYYDSLADYLRMQIKQNSTMKNNLFYVPKMPDWVANLGITAPEGMKYDPMASVFTSVENPTEGFNSVSMIFTGNYDTAVKEAAQLASKAKVKIIRSSAAIGCPANKKGKTIKPVVKYLNYDLMNIDQDFLMSIEVEPSGHLTLMVTDNKQLNQRLLAYEPMKNRNNRSSNRKKQ